MSNKEKILAILEKHGEMLKKHEKMLDRVSQKLDKVEVLAENTKDLMDVVFSTVKRHSGEISDLKKAQ